MKKFTWRSMLKTELEDYLELRAAQGRSAKEHVILNRLDAYLQQIDHNAKELSAAVIDGWVSSFPKSMHANTKIVYVSHYNSFAKYLNSIGIPAFMPERPAGEDTYVPYVFTSDEVRRMFEAADQLKAHPKLAMQLPIILRLLYCCGMRVNEVLRLTMMDIDFSTGTLIVRNGKGNKERYIPLNKSLSDLLKRYCGMTQKQPFSDELIFPNTKNQALSMTWVSRHFDRCLDSAGIVKPHLPRNARNICPHCFRHTFAVHTLHEQEQLGVDAYAAGPLLAAYMGHKTFRDTEYYLRLTDEISTQMLAKASAYASVFPGVPQ